MPHLPNKLGHKILNSPNKAYIPAVKDMDLFVLAVCVGYSYHTFQDGSVRLAGSGFHCWVHVSGVLAVLTKIQQHLLLAHNILTRITILGK